MPGESPDASCHAPVGPPLSFFFDRASPPAEVSFSGLTIDHAPAAVAEAVAEAAGAMGSAGLGAGVHEGSLGGMGVGSGAGRNGSTGAGVNGSGWAIG